MFCGLEEGPGGAGERESKDLTASPERADVVSLP